MLTFLLAVLAGQLAGQADANEEGRGAYKTRTLYNLEKYWDSTVICRNPHKGWEFHYFDNGIRRYKDRLQPNDYLEDFPGLSNIYLRLAWSYLEPEEGKYNWEVIDTVINKWTAKGYTISFRITFKETNDLAFSTPEWVKNAGAKPGDLVLILAGDRGNTLKALGELRLEMGSRLDLRTRDVFVPLWVVDFPLLEWDEEVG